MMAQQHYWLDDEVVYYTEQLDRLGVDYQSAVPVLHLWESICSLYLPRNLIAPNGPTFTGYSVKRKIDQGYHEYDFETELPYLVTSERHQFQHVQATVLGSGLGPGQGAQQRIFLREVLWVRVGRSTPT